MERFDSAVARWMAGPRWAVALVLVAACLVLWLPGLLTVPPTDRDESSFAQASRQMVESGDYVDIRLHDAPRLKKPAGIYWLQSLAVQAAEAVPGGLEEGDIATYRIVSLLGALAAVLLTARIGRILAGPAAGAAAALALASALVVGGEARIAKTDAVLLATVIGAMIPPARLWMRAGQGAPPPRGAALWFWGALGLSVLVKGPIGPLVVALALAALAVARRGLGWARPLVSLPAAALFLAIVLPWYAAITVRTGGDFWRTAVGQDLLGKVSAGREGHGAPPGTYLVLLWATFWPAAIPLALSLPAIRAGRRAGAAVFCLAWILPAWILFEAVPTKLPHYTMPVYPALAVLAVTGWAATPAPLGAAWRRAVLALLLALPLAALAATGLASMRWGGPFPAFALLGGAVVAAGGVLLWRAARGGHRNAALALLVPLAAGLQLGLFPTLARTPGIWPSARLGEIVRGFGDCPDPALIVAGYAEPSVVFTLGRGVALVSGAEAARLAAAAPCAVVAVESREAAAFAAAGPVPGLVPLGVVEGTNVGSGRDLRLEVMGRSAR